MGERTEEKKVFYGAAERLEYMRECQGEKVSELMRHSTGLCGQSSMTRHSVA